MEAADDAGAGTSVAGRVGGGEGEAGEEGEEEDLYGDLVVERAPAAREDGGKAEIRADAADGAAGGPRAEESRSLAARLEDAERELERMRAERAVLVKNMSCIYKTAKAEIARKDCIIEDLRKKAFRPKGG